MKDPITIKHNTCKEDTVHTLVGEGVEDEERIEDRMEEGEDGEEEEQEEEEEEKDPFLDFDSLTVTHFG